MNWSLRVPTKADRLDYLCEDQRTEFERARDLKPVVRICAGSNPTRYGEQFHFSWDGVPGHWVVISDPQIPTIAEQHESFGDAVERFETLTGTKIR